MENVLLAAGPARSVDLFIITTSEDAQTQLRRHANALRLRHGSVLRHVVVALGNNKGADIGFWDWKVTENHPVN